MAMRLVEDDPPPVNDPALLAVLQRHGLVDQGGRWVISTTAAGGPGPKLDPAVVEKFRQLDTTRSLKNLDWMLLAAGGSSGALAESKRRFEETKNLWLGERMAGRGDDGQPTKPMSQEEAAAAWVGVEPAFRSIFFPADQDTLEGTNFAVFGYVRLWPGASGVYEKVFDETKTFLENVKGRAGNQSKISQVNLARMKRAEQGQYAYTPVETELNGYSSIGAIEDTNDEFKMFFQRRTAAKDIQFVGAPKGAAPEATYARGKDVKFYEDENITCYVPATAAAMMQVGFDNWCVANKTEFERAFTHKRKDRSPPHWTGYSQAGPFMVVHFKGDVGEPQTPPGHEHHQSLKRLAVHIRTELCDIPNLESPYEGVQFFDRINRWMPKPVDWPELIQRLGALPNGQALAKSLDAALITFIDWARQMKDGDIKVSVYERLAALLVYNLLYS